MSDVVADEVGSPAHDEGLRYRVLHDTTSVTRSIAEAIVLKEGNLFFLSEPGGFVPLVGRHGFGLYYNDCRYLDGYELRIAGLRPDVLVSATPYGYTAISQLAVPDILMADGRLLPKEELGIKRQHMIASDPLAMYDVITFHNYGPEPIEFPVDLTFDAGFQDVFAVRGMPREQRGTTYAPTWQAQILTFTYEGADGLVRSLDLQFSIAPRFVDGGTVHFRLLLPPRKMRRLVVSLAVAEWPLGRSGAPTRRPPPDLRQVETLLKRSSDEWMSGEIEVRTNSLALNAIIDRSLRDLRVLRSEFGGQEYFAAGVPWFATLFGRDSLITALQMLAYNPRLAEHTLRLLAKHQGQHDDPWRDEEPGKILHELRWGEMARTGEIPHTPYYGTVDATPLFLMLVAEHAAWTGSLALFQELRGNVEAALEWIDKHGDLDGDGYVEYHCRSTRGLANQGWRDSGDGVPNADGTLAKPPIALVEAQAYVYAAKARLADLYRRAGEPDRAERLEREAAELRDRFNRDFWLESEGIYALALQAENKPAATMSSNPGHALWAGIADEDKARRTVERLLASDMFSGWGIRTLSEREVRYNPTGYHLGTIWPHDNSLIAAGFHRYGFDREAALVFDAIVLAAMRFPDYRLPELFMGFPREEYGVPVSYPVACRPQAWAAGAVPYMISELLGLRPDGFENRLRIVRPVLPAFLQYVEVRRLRVGAGMVDLRCERTPTGNIAVDVLKIDPPLEVVMELAVH